MPARPFAVSAPLAIMATSSAAARVSPFPGQFAHMAQENPDRASLQWPLTIFSIREVACVQVVIVSTWKLLTMVRRDSIFSTDALRWVDAIVWSIAAGWTMLAVLCPWRRLCN